MNELNNNKYLPGGLLFSGGKLFCLKDSRYAPILAPLGNVPYRLMAFRTF